MIDHSSAATISRAARKAHDMVTAQIAAEPLSPIVADLQKLADQLEALVTDNARTIAILERKIR